MVFPNMPAAIAEGAVSFLATENGELFADKEGRGFAVLRAQQDLATALYQAERIGEIGGDARKRKQKGGVTAAEQSEPRNAGKSLGGEKLAQNGEGIVKVGSFLQRTDVAGTD